MRPLRLKSDTHGVSPIISAILLLTIMLVTVGTIMAWAIPRLNGVEQDAHYDGVFSGIEVFDTRVDDVIYGGEGTVRSSQLAVGGGDIYFQHDNGYWMVYWSLIRDNVTFSEIDSEDSEFSLFFDETNNNNLTVNITGSGRNETLISQEGKVTPGFEFGDIQYIHVGNSTQELAEAFYIRMNVLEYQIRTNHGYFEIKWMNGAIVTNKGSSIGYVSKTPYVYESGDNLFINLVNLTANRTGIISGDTGSYDLTITHLGSDILAAKTVYGPRISISSEYQKGWYTYFTTSKDYTAVRNERYKTIAVGFNPGKDTEIKLIKSDIEILGGT